MTRLTLLLLAACEPVKTPSTETPVETGEGEGETATPEPILYDVTSAAGTAALGWSEDRPAFAGYSGTGANQRIYLADPLGDGSAAYVYGIPWTSEGALIMEDAADVVITVGVYGPDKIGYEGDYLAIPDADADVGDIPSAGIGYSLAEPTTSGALATLSPLSVSGDTESGYAARILRLDADLDGDADDMIATQSTYDSDDIHGEIGVFLDVAERPYLWSEADYQIPACTDFGSTAISYGPVDLALDADGAHLWVACPSATYRTGAVEVYSLPLSAVSVPDGGVQKVGGWTVAADPRGGAWMGSQGGGVVTYATADLTTVISAYPYETESDSGSLFGARPEVIETEGGQVLLIVGAQTRTAEMRAAPDGGDAGVSAAYLCDITDMPTEDETGFADLTAACGRYTAPEGVACVGAVNGLIERADGLYFFSSGWLFGSGDGCGAAIWSVKS